MGTTASGDTSMKGVGTEMQDIGGNIIHVFSDEDEPLPYPGWCREGDYSWLFTRGLPSS